MNPNEVNKERIINFYRLNKLTLPKDYKLRFFKGQTLGKQWVYMYPESEGHLRRMCSRLNIKDLYYSVSLFRNPKKVRSKKGFKYQFLNSDLVLDIDTKDEDNLSKIYYYIRDYCEYFIPSTRNTNRGYQVEVKGFRDYLASCEYTGDPWTFENHVFNEKKKMCQYLIKNGCDIDYEVCIDNWRIVRVIGSLHRSGSIINLQSHSST